MGSADWEASRAGLTSDDAQVGGETSEKRTARKVSNRDGVPKKNYVLRKDDLTAIVFDAAVGGPAVGPSGQTYRNAVPSGEDDLACRTCVFPTTQNQPPLSRVTTVPVQEPAVDSRRKRSGTRLALTPSRSTLPSLGPAGELLPVP